MHAFCGFFIWKAVQNLRLVCIVTSYCWWQDIILFFFARSVTQLQVRLGSSTLVHREGGAKSVGWVVLVDTEALSRRATEIQSKRMQQAIKLAEAASDDEVVKHWEGAASCCDWCSRVSQLFHF